MQIVVLGLNHKSAPIEIREKLAFDTAETIRALRQLKSRFREALDYSSWQRHAPQRPGLLGRLPGFDRGEMECQHPRHGELD